MKNKKILKSLCLIIALIGGISISAKAECNARNITDIHGKVHCSAVSCDPCDCSCGNNE